ncbi:growth inhibitor PemK [Candidatus Pacearchaeota archaeon]|nr:growth inhibitor PemK [Candidatus Pacearchaeota archaeon]|tara:strand:- start:1418 stop:1750 length:333 start_codon:yes stop_codon:yes gene_type:complete
MEKLVKGIVIVIEFPFSDLKSFKRRPALIIKVPKGEDIIICQITAESQSKSVEIPIRNEDFANGGLKRNSFLRLDKVTTIRKSRIKYRLGLLKQSKIDIVVDKFCSFLRE